jgi:hypothetical protein
MGPAAEFWPSSRKLEGISCSRRKSDKGARRREIDLIVEMPRKLLIGTPYKLLEGEKKETENGKRVVCLGFGSMDGIIGGRKHHNTKLELYYYSRGSAYATWEAASIMHILRIAGLQAEVLPAKQNPIQNPDI